MNENQKKVLIATAIGLVIWSGYRLYIKRPIPPMRPVKSADTSGTGSTNFTGYSDMSGGNSPARTGAYLENLQSELAQINNLLEKGLGSLTTSQLNKLRGRKKMIEASGYITSGDKNKSSKGSSADKKWLSKCSDGTLD